jgi:hypothetical protein
MRTPLRYSQYLHLGVEGGGFPLKNVLLGPNFEVTPLTLLIYGQKITCLVCVSGMNIANGKKINIFDEYYSYYVLSVLFILTVEKPNSTDSEFQIRFRSNEHSRRSVTNIFYLLFKKSSPTPIHLVYLYLFVNFWKICNNIYFFGSLGSSLKSTVHTIL